MDEALPQLDLRFAGRSGGARGDGQRRTRQRKQHPRKGKSVETSKIHGSVGDDIGPTSIERGKESSSPSNLQQSEIGEGRGSHLQWPKPQNRPRPAFQSVRAEASSAHEDNPHATPTHRKRNRTNRHKLRNQGPENSNIHQSGERSNGPSAPLPVPARRRGFGAQLSVYAPPESSATVDLSQSVQDHSTDKFPRVDAPVFRPGPGGESSNAGPGRPPRARGNRRGRGGVNFGSQHLGQVRAKSELACSDPDVSKTPHPVSLDENEDISTRIHREIGNGSYECMVCYGGVTRKAKVWYCRCCWAVYHLNCIQKWGKQGLEKNPTGPIGVEGEPPRSWRCPTCNNPNGKLPEIYTCWCEKESQPENTRYLPPHSCGQTCGKQFLSPKKCPHSCSSQCHAGPCPPCSAMGPVQACFCGKESSQKRCVDANYDNGWSCGQVCGDLMPCGIHTCSKPCHPLSCGSCEVTEELKCFCGNEIKNIKCCDKQDPKKSFGSSNNMDGLKPESWMGHYNCGKVCDRLLACGVHQCKNTCHPQDIVSGICPSDPAFVTTCACGKTPLEEVLSEPRLNCQADIPTCSKVCKKTLPCGHVCLLGCHAGDCGICIQYTDVTCRCRKTTSSSFCHQGAEFEPPQCMRNCRAALNCGRHECGEKCCSGEQKAQERLSAKKKIRPINTHGFQTSDGFEPEHICVRPCGRLLKCGKHNCLMLCHRGPCGTCLEASFEELTCSCGRTAIQPPVPCGSKLPHCNYPCARPKECGHPLVPHECHPDEEECPKCPYLTEKLCKCGKKTVRAVPCWRESVSCGTPCGKKLSCGSHSCQLVCHDTECQEPCKQKCGKIKLVCGHPCVDSCHAPFQCSEDKPCQEKLRLLCACRGLKQDVKCGASKAKPAGNKQELACTDACRNRRLALALDLDPERDGTSTYSDQTITAYNRDSKWATIVEQKFRVFAENKEQKRLQFTPMRAALREFLHLLAADYGLDSESQDPEPYRSVVIRKPTDFSPAPRRTLAEFTATKLPGSSASSMGVQQLKKISRGQAVNAFVLKGARVGILVSELEKEILSTLRESQLRFDVTWYGDEYVLLKPQACSLAIDQIEAELRSLSTKLKRTVASKGLAESTETCWVGQDGRISNSDGAAGWSFATPRKSAPASTYIGTPALVSKNGFDLFSGAGGSSAAVISGSQHTKNPKGVEGKKNMKKDLKEDVVDDWEMEAED